VHHHHVSHSEALLLEQGFDLPEGVRGLCLGVAPYRRRAFIAVRGVTGDGIARSHTSVAYPYG